MLSKLLDRDNGLEKSSQVFCCVLCSSSSGSVHVLIAAIPCTCTGTSRFVDFHWDATEMHIPMHM